MEIGLSKTSNMLDFQNAAIGDHTNDSVVVSNDGKLAADFKLAGELDAVQSAGPLDDQLQLIVSKGTTQLYSGSVAGFNAADGFDLGTLYPKQGNRSPKNLTLNFQLSFPTTGTDAGDDLLQSLGPIDQRFRVNATQHTGAQSNRPSDGNGNGNGNGNENGPKPKQNVAGESEEGTSGGSTGGSAGGSTGGVTSPGLPADVATVGAGGSDSGDTKDGSPDKNGTAGGGNDASPEATDAATEGPGKPDEDDSRLGILLLVGLFGCAAASILWWGLRTPGGSNA